MSIKKAGLRPKRSAAGPPMTAPNTAPRTRAEPIRPIMSALSEKRPIAIIHDKPKKILIEVAQIGNDCDSYLLDTLIMQCTCKMMVINDVMPVLWTKDHRDHMFAEKLVTLFCTFSTPMLAFGFYLTHPDGYLRWA